MYKAAQLVTAEPCKWPVCPSTDKKVRKMWYIYKITYYLVIKDIFQSLIGKQDVSSDYNAK